MEPRDDNTAAVPTEAWAILRTGGKQYRVRTGDRLDVARSGYIAATVPGADGRRLFSFDDILVVRSPGGETIVGAPNVPNARVVAELLPEKRGRKVIAFKKRRRQNSRRRRGHRQAYQPVVVVAVECGTSPPASVLAPPPGTIRAVPVESSWADRISPVLAGLRGEAPDEALAWLTDPEASTTWADAPAWVRGELVRAVEPSLTGEGSRRRWTAATALSAVIGGPTGASATPEAVAKALEGHFDRSGRRHFLDVEVRADGGPTGASDPSRRYQARVRLRDILDMPVGNVSLKLSHGIPAGAVLQTQVAGPGIDPDAVRVVMRRERPAGTFHEWIADFTNDPGAGEHAILDVVLDGRRVERRFLLLDSLTVTREPPVPRAGGAEPAHEAGGASSSTPSSPAQGSASSA